MMAGHLGWGRIGEEGWRKGPWTAEEDRLLIEYVRVHGEGRWNSVARLTGIKRNGKSSRLRWVNYLRPDLKKGHITPYEEGIILELHAKWGNRWSTIARSLPGRTDNEIKNYWRTHFKKKAKVPSDAGEKAKTRLLRRQQFLQKQQQQQQQQYQYQQQPQQLQLDLEEMKRVMAEEERDNRKASYLPQSLPLVRQDTTTFYPQATEDPSLIFSMFNNNALISEASGEDVLWDALWNLDDVHGNFSPPLASNKASVHNLFVPFC